MRTPLPTLTAALALSGCITETTVLRQTPTGTIRVPAQTPLPGTADLSRPTDPGAVSTSRVTVAVKPLGTIPYDGLVLPLISPDGKFLAVQQGRPPAWPTLLAARDATPPLGTSLVVYDLSGALAATTRPGAPRLVNFPGPLPGASLLGRSADRNGFLIEQARADGLRRIGRVGWLTGEPEWLTPEDQSAAHAVLGPAGELAYSRPSTSNPDRFELVYRPRAEDAAHEIVLASPTESYVFPLFSAETDRLYTLVLPSATSRMALLSLSRPARADADSQRLRPIARDVLNVTPSMLAAYQAVVAAQSPLPPMPLRGVAIFDASPGIGSVVWLEPGAGVRVVFPGGTVASAPLVNPGAGTTPDIGFLASTPRGLLYQKVQAKKGESSLQAAGGAPVVLAGGSIPRSLWRTTPGPGVSVQNRGDSGEGATHLLFNPPSRAEETVLGISALSPGAQDSPNPKDGENGRILRP